MTRSCGECSLCCKLMGVPEVKQPHKWCPHALPGCGGCAIYEDRPVRCREFSCRWLLDQTLSDIWFPVKSRIIIDIRENPLVMAFVVDPVLPNRWREEPWFSQIKKLAAAGLGHWSTVILIGDEKIPIIAERAIQHGRGSGRAPYAGPVGKTGSHNPIK